MIYVFLWYLIGIFSLIYWLRKYDDIKLWELILVFPIGGFLGPIVLIMCLCTFIKVDWNKVIIRKK